MGIKKYKPTSPGTRFRSGYDFTEITETKPYKPLVVQLKRTGGRNSMGRVTAWQKGGGHKRAYRIIDFKRDKINILCKVETIEYDPNRTARIALLKYADGARRYIIAPLGIKVGESLISGPDAEIKNGNALPLKNIPLGTIIHNIELKPGKGGAIARSAGTYAQLAAREGKYATIKLPSGESRMVLTTCRATIGTVSNPDHNLERSGKAGRTRWQGRRPRVRGVVMNPVDHPMGGGEGRASGGHPRSRKGIPAKGFKTRDTKKYSAKFIIERRKK